MRPQHKQPLPLALLPEPPTAHSSGSCFRLLSCLRPRLRSRFRWRSFRVAGEDRTFDEIEHAILRPEFREPRVHFALVCGATSCPVGESCQRIMSSVYCTW